MPSLVVHHSRVVPTTTIVVGVAALAAGAVMYDKGGPTGDSSTIATIELRASVSRPAVLRWRVGVIWSVQMVAGQLPRSRSRPVASPWDGQGLLMRNLIAACIVVLVVMTGCQKRDPLFCESHEDNAQCALSDALSDALPMHLRGSSRLGGTVLTNLTGTDLVLKTTPATISDRRASPFQFSTPIEMGSPYSVSASSQPTGPSQMCTIANGSGTANGDVTDVTVSCTTNTFTISGSVYGLNTGETLVPDAQRTGEHRHDHRGTANPRRRASRSHRRRSRAARDTVLRSVASRRARRSARSRVAVARSATRTSIPSSSTVRRARTFSAAP